MNEVNVGAIGAARSDWLHHLHLILSGAAQIARVVDVEKCSAIGRSGCLHLACVDFLHRLAVFDVCFLSAVHCSDGWDRTPQLTATAQVASRLVFAARVHSDWNAEQSMPS